MSTELSTIVEFLDRELWIGDFEDASHNGLQVENSGRIGRVCCGVDASMEFFEAAAGQGADLLVCHHGLSWNDSLKRISGLNYRRLKFLLDHDLALYACHLPLDAHPRCGNNILIARALKLQQVAPFGLYNGREIGFAGRLPAPVRYATFKRRVAEVMGNNVQSMDFGKKSVQSVAVISGGAAAEIEEAGRKGIDVYVSGEPALIAYSLAQEYGLNAVFAGHYATEVWGVRALGEMLAKRFGVRAECVDLKIAF